MDEEGPIPKLPPLELFIKRSNIPPASVSSLVSSYQKFCDFLTSHLYTSYVLTMDDVRYNRCRDNLKGQRQMAIDISKKYRMQCNIQIVKKRRDATINGDWSTRPEDLFRLMAKFATLDLVKDHLENMAKGFHAKFRYTFK